MYFFTMKKTLRLILILLLFSPALLAQTTFPDYYPDSPPPKDHTVYPWGFQYNVGTSTITQYKPYIINGMPFRLLFPLGFDSTSTSNKKYPLVILLHGISEKGVDNNHQLKYGGREHAEAVNKGYFDGFVMVPQNNSGNGLWPSGDLASVMKFIDLAIEDLQVDEYRVQIEGYSGGGSAAWNLVNENPKRFAGLVAMSTTQGTNYAEKLKYTATWHSQGGLDSNPAPSWGNGLRDKYQAIGANYYYYFYEDLGHGTWTTTYKEPDFFPYLSRNSILRIHPLFFKSNFCQDEEIAGKMGIQSGFEAYEWMKDGQPIGGATGHEISFNALGKYQVRLKNKGEWTAWSEPLEIKRVAPTPTPAITALGPTALPTLDGRTSVTLEAPEAADGNLLYEWSTGETNRRITVSSEGSYSVVTTEKFGCSSASSAPVIVTFNKVGVLPAPTNLVVSPLSASSLQLTWSDQSNNETGFELYRSMSPDGPWQLAAMLTANTTSFSDQGLNSQTRYYYSLRAVNNEGGSDYATANGKTSMDNEAPSAPANLQITSNTRSSISLAWEPSTDNADGPGTIMYEIYSNNKTKLIATTTETRYTVSGLAEEQSFTFAVRAKDVSGNLSPFSNQVTGSTSTNGLIYSYYERDFSSVHQMSSMDPIKTGRVPNFDVVTHRNRPLMYGFKFEGYINIPRTGEYTFYTNSDDGSAVILQGFVVVNNDGRRQTAGMVEKSGKITLTAGFHEIIVFYFNKEALVGLEVYWEGPGIAKQLIPDAAFTDNFKPGTPPNKPSNVSAVAEDQQSIKISWKDNSSDETGFELYRSTSNEGPFTFVAAAEANATSFTDTDLLPSTTYYYKVLAVSAAGESEFADTGADGKWANATTLPASDEPVPASPGNLTASREGDTAIQLNWTDNADDEENIELFRNGSLLISLPANTTSYLDEEVNTSTAYTYAVRAVNSYGASPFSNEVTVAAGDDDGGGEEPVNSAPVLSPIGDISVRYDKETIVSLSATDQDGDALSFSAENLPAFARLENLSNGRARLVLQPASADQGSYPNVRILVTDAANASASETITIRVSDNEAPQLTAIAAQTITEKESRTLTVYAFDPERDAITLSLVSPPGFVSLADEGNGRAKVSLRPGYGDSGSYTISIKAEDAWGNASVGQFELTVQDAITEYTVMINFNDRIHENAPAPWNNFDRYPAKGAGINNVLDTESRRTKIDVSMLDDFGRHDYGATTGNNSGLYPDAVLKSYFYNHSGEVKRIRIKDLDPDLTYTFSILGSTTYGANNPPSEYLINGVSKKLEVQNNTSNVVRFENLKAPDGEITIGIRQPADSRYSFINALVIEVQYEGSNNGGGDTSLPAAPSQLSASLNEDKTVLLRWTDNASNESIFEIQKSSDNTNFEKIGESPANTSTFTDPAAFTASEGTRYYRVRAGNANGFSAWSNVTQLKEDGDGGGDDDETIPTAPTQLSASLAATNMVQLSWTDISGNEEGFSIHRSTDGTTFTELATTAANSISFEDPTTHAAGSSLSYRVRAFNAAGDSEWSNVASITIPEDGDEEAPLAPSQLSATLASDNNVLLRWTDNADNESSFEIQKSTDGTTFVALGETGANTTVFTDPSPDRNGANFYRVRASNQVGASAWSNTALLNLDGSNQPPVIEGIPSTVIASEGEQTEITFDLYDPEGLPLQLTTRNMPGFARIEQFTATTGKLILTPTIMDRGSYPGVQFTAYDGALETDVTFTIQVADGKKRATYINFNQGFGASKPWNNTITAPSANKVLQNLLDESGQNTGYSLTLVDAWGGSGETGETSGNNSGIFPDIVTRSHYWADAGKTIRLKVAGLSPNLRYNFVFYGSTIRESKNGNTNYSIGSETVSLEVQSNIENTVQINGIKADAKGEVEIRVNGSGGKRSFLGAMVIEQYPDGGLPLKPEDFRAYAVSRTQVDLRWHDKSYQETGFEIWRRELPAGDFAQVHTTAPNATSYSDTGLKSNTGYEYKIRARSASGNSAYTPTQQAATFSYLVYINVNYKHEFNQPSPWNNLTQAPTEGRNWNNFLNDNQMGTGINMRLEKAFDGGNSAGADANGQGIYPDKVIKSFYFTERGVVAKMQFSGLNKNLLYNFRMFSSSTFNSNHGVTEFRIGSKKRTLEIQSNISKTTVIRDVRPDEKGTVTLEVESGEFDNYGILNAVVLEVRDSEKETKGASGRYTSEDATAQWHVEQNNGQLMLYPNPSQGALAVEFWATKAETYRLHITDVSGRVVHVAEYEATEGHNKLELDLTNPAIRPGLYLLRMKSMDFNSKVTRFMKQ
jgi:fibronectin type 3 domain-containing protein/pimeloyl-ACP methyl ester carboxylesterase